MFSNLKRVVYKVSDIEKAKNWYKMILGKDPILDLPFIVHFQIGETELTIIPDTSPTENCDNVIAYWEVDDINSVYQQLIDAGASVHSAISSSFGIKRAALTDPFGNVIGIMSRDSIPISKSIEHQPSQTAMGVTTMRALAAKDEREEIRGKDYMAEYFLTEERRTPLKDRATRDWIMKNKVTPGMYEYMIARTEFFDNIFEKALSDKTTQIVLLGAGYDSRPYRFKHLINKTRIFELDIHTTQQNKKELLHKSNIPIPEQVTFVPINFSTDDPKNALLNAGYDTALKTLFIWEGVVYYLTEKTVDKILQFVHSSSGEGSSICFDYGFRSSDIMKKFGVKELNEKMKTENSGEPTRFFIESGKIESFLQERGFKILEHHTPEEMEKIYLTLRNGSSAGKVVGNLSLVHAAVLP